MLPSRVVGDIYLVNCEACDWKSGDLRSGHLLISDEDWFEEEGSVSPNRER